jgi:acyl carrier protein
MDVVHPRCAGIDFSKKDAKVCIRVQGQGRRRASSMVTTWGATTSQIPVLREHLIAEKVTCVVIESTSDYWRPFYYLLDDALNMMLVNASRVHNVPGRKTDLLTELPRLSRGGCVPGGVGLARFAARDQRWRFAAAFGGAGGADSGGLETTGDLFQPYRLVDAEGAVAAPVAAYVAELTACGRPATTQRSYGMDLLRWFRFLWALGVAWPRLYDVAAPNIGLSCWTRHWGYGGDVTGSAMQDRIRDVLAAHGGMKVDPREVDDQADLYELGLTSLASVNVMLALEDVFGVEFPEEVVKKSTFASVRNIEQVVEGLVKSSA